MITIDPSLHNNTTPLYDDQFVLVNRTSTILTGLYRGTDEIEDPIKTDLRNSIIVEIERSEEHTSELQSHSFISYAVFCLKKKKKE